MKILLTFNETYAPHAAAVITGLIKHSSKPLSIAVLYTTLEDDTINKFKQYYVNRLESIEFHKVELEGEFVESLLNVRGQKHLKGKIETYLRLFAPLYIDDDDIIYLDCDIVVNGDVTEMIDEVDHRFYISAVKEYDPAYKYKDLNNTDKWNAPGSLYSVFVRDAMFTRFRRFCHQSVDVPYFCAGIMYLNLKKWKEDNLIGKMMDAIQKYKSFYFADQDIVNCVTEGKFGVLHPKWDSFVTNFGFTSGYSSKELEEAATNPAIVHMAGEYKPWTKGVGGKYRELYWQYRMDTPWPESYKMTVIEKAARKLVAKLQGVKRRLLLCFQFGATIAKPNKYEQEWNTVYLQ